MKPPYYAVIFTNQLSDHTEGYTEMAKKMERLASQQEGYLGMDHARSDLGITISYWTNLEAIAHWKSHWEHLEAQVLGKKKWYEQYRVRICKVEREYSFQSKQL